jgi:hypothetical protein
VLILADNLSLHLLVEMDLEKNFKILEYDSSVLDDIDSESRVFNFVQRGSLGLLASINIDLFQDFTHNDPALEFLSDCALNLNARTVLWLLVLLDYVFLAESEIQIEIQLHLVS